MADLVPTPIKIGSFWTNILAESKGQSVNFEEVTTWFDGTPMDDSKCDSVVYRKLPASVGGGYVKRVYDGSFVDISWFGVKGDGLNDYTEIIQRVLSVYPMVKFPVGTYIISETLLLRSQSTIRGDLDQKLHNTHKAVIFRGLSSNLGDGGTIIKCSESPNSSQSISIENITFYGDTPANYTNLSIIPDEGVYAIDPSGVKEGLYITNCHFRNTRCAIRAVQGHAYIDLVKVDNCAFSRNRSCVEFSPTTGAYFNACMFYDNYTVGEVDNIYCDACSFNNSSFSADVAGIVFRTGVFTKPWLEGYNNFFQVKQGGYLSIEAGALSETFSTQGTTKCYIMPVAGATGFTAIMNGCRIGTNTRVFNLNGILSNLSGVQIEMNGCYDGTNFAYPSSNLYYYTQRGLGFAGKGNTQGWNVVSTRTAGLLGAPLVAGGGQPVRFGSLRHKFYFTNNISFRLTFPEELKTNPSTALSLDTTSFILVGTNNGAGGNAAYFAKVHVYNGFGTTWSFYKEGPNNGLYTVELSSESNTGVIVTVTATHPGTGDILVLESSTENGKIEIL